MQVEVVLLPRMLEPAAQVRGRSVVVLDVLRATTSMVAALAAGARQIRIFESIDAVRRAAAQAEGALLCGEVKALLPTGFDFGNSPGDFTAERCAGRTLLMSTTNGTRAMLAAAASEPQCIYAAALVNARATAGELAKTDVDVTLLCSGTDGAISMEDLLGAGAILHELRSLLDVELRSDAALVADHLSEACRDRLPVLLRASQGGRNVLAAGLDADIAFAARLNAIPLVARVDAHMLTVTRST